MIHLDVSLCSTGRDRGRFKMDQRVVKAIFIIKADLSRTVPTGELARTVNLSTSHLNHLFKTAVGLTITRYVKALRMERAKELLETTFLSVKEIGRECGLKDESHFVQNFKAAHGLTPLRYRWHYQSTHLNESKTLNGDTQFGI
jgi:transcriptional regulator GlxA family with amidase domain